MSPGKIPAEYTATAPPSTLGMFVGPVTLPRCCDLSDAPDLRLADGWVAWRHAPAASEHGSVIKCQRGGTGCGAAWLVIPAVIAADPFTEDGKPRTWEASAHRVANDVKWASRLPAGPSLPCVICRERWDLAKAPACPTCKAGHPFPGTTPAPIEEAHNGR